MHKVCLVSVLLFYRVYSQCTRLSTTYNCTAIVNVVFRPGAEYVYHYESEAVTGIRTVSDQLSGVKVRSTVKIQIHRDGTALLKVRFPTSRSYLPFLATKNFI